MDISTCLIEEKNTWLMTDLLASTRNMFLSGLQIGAKRVTYYVQEIIVIYNILI